MKERIIIGFVFISLTVLFLTLLNGQSGTLGSKLNDLHDKLRRYSETSQQESRSLWEHSIVTADQLRGEFDQKLSQRGDSLNEKLVKNDELTKKTSSELNKLKSKVTIDIDLLYKEILGPSAQIESGSNVGGGIVVYSTSCSQSEYEALILTAFHVVKKSIKKEGDKEKMDDVIVRVFNPSTNNLKEHKSQIVTYDKGKDIALLRIVSSESLGVPSRFASREKIKSLKIFTPVLTVGCPLGHEPFPTGGAISSLNKDVAGEKFWIMSAPTIFGNSGGGVFLKESHELIGVASMICTFDNLVSTPVYHMSIFMPLDRVYDWFDSIGYEFVYNPSAKKDLDKINRLTGLAKTN